MQTGIDETIKRVIDVKNSVALVVYEGGKTLYTHTDNVSLELLEQFNDEKADEVRPSVEGTLKRCDCEIGNLLDQHVLDPEWKSIFIDLHNQVRNALS